MWGWIRGGLRSGQDGLHPVWKFTSEVTCLCIKENCEGFKLVEWSNSTSAQFQPMIVRNEAILCKKERTGTKKRKRNAIRELNNKIPFSFPFVLAFLHAILVSNHDSSTMESNICIKSNLHNICLTVQILLQPTTWLSIEMSNTWKSLRYRIWCFLY